MFHIMSVLALMSLRLLLCGASLHTHGDRPPDAMLNQSGAEAQAEPLCVADLNLEPMETLTLWLQNEFAFSQQVMPMTAIIIRLVRHFLSIPEFSKLFTMDVRLVDNKDHLDPDDSLNMGCALEVLPDWEVTNWTIGDLGGHEDRVVELSGLDHDSPFPTTNLPPTFQFTNNHPYRGKDLNQQCNFRCFQWCKIHDM